MGDARVLEKLNEIDGEETFANSAFAVEDEVETFHVLWGLSIRICAMRGPRVRGGRASLPLVAVGVSADWPASAAGTASVVVSPPFADVGAGGRFRLGRLRGRTASPST